MLKEILEHKSKEDGVFIPQLLGVRVFDIVDDLVIEVLIHRPCIFI